MKSYHPLTGWQWRVWKHMNPQRYYSEKDIGPRGYCLKGLFEKGFVARITTWTPNGKVEIRYKRLPAPWEKKGGEVSREMTSEKWVCPKCNFYWNFGNQCQSCKWVWVEKLGREMTNKERCHK